MRPPGEVGWTGEVGCLRGSSGPFGEGMGVAGQQPLGGPDLRVGDQAEVREAPSARAAGQPESAPGRQPIDAGAVGAPYADTPARHKS